MLYTQDSLVYFDLVFHISTGLPIIKVSKMKQIARFPIGLFFFFSYWTFYFNTYYYIILVTLLSCFLNLTVSLHLILKGNLALIFISHKAQYLFNN